MELQDELIKSFTQAIKPSGGEKSSEKTVYAEVARIDRNEQTGEEVIKIKIDGSELETPVTSMVKVGVGDRVFATIKDHSVVITGNISWPSLTRIENVYMTMTADGLVIGQLDDENNPTGYRILISPSNTTPGIYIIDDQNQIVSTFGTTVKLGKANSYQAELTSSGMNILSPSGDVIATYGSEIRIGKDGANTLVITNTSVTNETYANWSVFRAKSYSGSGGGLVAEYSFCSDLAGGGGIYRGSGSFGDWVLYFSGAAMEIGPTSQKKLRISTTEDPTIGGTKIAMVGDYIKKVSHYQKISSGNAAKVDAYFTPSVPTGYSIFGITQVYINDDNWALSAYYITSDSPSKIHIKVHTVDGTDKTKPSYISIDYLIVRTS